MPLKSVRLWERAGASLQALGYWPLVSVPPGPGAPAASPSGWFALAWLHAFAPLHSTIGAAREKLMVAQFRCTDIARASQAGCWRSEEIGPGETRSALKRHTNGISWFTGAQLQQQRWSATAGPPLDLSDGDATGDRRLLRDRAVPRQGLQQLSLTSQPARSSIAPLTAREASAPAARQWRELPPADFIN